MKTIGIIGGFGPEATAQFYLRLVAAGRAKSNGRQPHIIMRNVSVPSLLEHDALVLGKNLDTFAPLLTNAARALERDGADVIVLPCNTLHVHEAAIRKSVSLPFISIVKETVRFLTHNNITKIGFLGSRVTVKENLFQKTAPSISFHAVNNAVQKDINKGLDLFVGTQDAHLLKLALRNAFLFLQKQQVEDVLLACTDFHGLCPPASNMQIHDTLEILVRATVDML